MTQLEKLLFEQTQTLKQQYVEKCIDWAKREFVIFSERAKWSDEQWCKHLNVEPVVRTNYMRGEYKTFPEGFFNSKISRRYFTEREKCKSIVKIGLDGHILRAETNAIAHYEHSIKKLAFRIERKNLNQELIEMKTSHVGINVETLITDGTKTVRAWTILAHGPVQCPHYRYLIK
jgi:hypothetical protein